MIVYTVLVHAPFEFDQDYFHRTFSAIINGLRQLVIGRIFVPEKSFQIYGSKMALYILLVVLKCLGIYSDLPRSILLL